MEEIKKVQKQIEDKEKEIQPLRDKLNELYQKQGDAIQRRVDNALKGDKDQFMLNELRYAAFTRCDCGAGMAYPNRMGPFGSWYCGDILLGWVTSDKRGGWKKHTKPLPFALYEIKSEDQPSAGGSTTRPK